jgi:hypothetical protein
MSAAATASPPCASFSWPKRRILEVTPKIHIQILYKI